MLSGEDQWRSDTADLFAGVPRVIVTRAGLHDADGAPLAAEPPPPPHEARPDDPAFIVFTSGTTGQPKGIVHAHRWLPALGDANRRRIPPRPDDVALATGEWSFVSALGHNVLFPLRNGFAASILEERPTPERILATIARDGVTLLYSVATLYRRILGTAGIEKKYDLSSLRGANSTGEPLEASVRAEWEARFGCPLWEHYGISEIQMVLGVGPEKPAREGGVGISWGARAAILGEDDEPLPAGSVGTLAFDASYPGLFLEYLGDEARTKAARRNGWYVTTDLARMDEDGYVYILGRADDCFKSKGVLIAPREIEEALLGLGTIEEACVFPIRMRRSAIASAPRSCRAPGPAQPNSTRRRSARRSRAASRASSARTWWWRWRRCRRTSTERLNAPRSHAWRSPASRKSKGRNARKTSFARPRSRHRGAVISGAASAVLRRLRRQRRPSASRPAVRRAAVSKRSAYLPNSLPSSSALPVSTKSAADLPSATWYVPSAMRHWFALSSKRASRRGSTTSTTSFDSPGFSTTRSNPSSRMRFSFGPAVR